MRSCRGGGLGRGCAQPLATRPVTGGPVAADGDAVRRRRLPWLLALPLMVAGSLAAHAAGYALGPTAHEDAHAEAAELAAVPERASGGFGGHAVLWLGLLAGLLAVVASRALVLRLRRRDGRRLGAGCFFLLPLLAYSSQELIERLLRAESVPFDAALEPGFLLGLALQVPFAAVTFLLAWLLLRVGERLIRLLGKAPLRLLRRRALALPVPSALVFPRIRPLSRGHPLRGPPLLA